MRKDMTKLIDVFHNSAKAPISAIVLLWNINTFVFIKKGLCV